MWSKRSLWKRCSEINVSRHWSTWAYMGTTQQLAVQNQNQTLEVLGNHFCIGLGNPEPPLFLVGTFFKSSKRNHHFMSKMVVDFQGQHTMTNQLQQNFPQCLPLHKFSNLKCWKTMKASLHDSHQSLPVRYLRLCCPRGELKNMNTWNAMKCCVDSNSIQSNPFLQWSKGPALSASCSIALWVQTIQQMTVQRNFGTYGVPGTKFLCSIFVCHVLYVSHSCHVVRLWQPHWKWLAASSWNQKRGLHPWVDRAAVWNPDSIVQLKRPTCNAMTMKRAYRARCLTWFKVPEIEKWCVTKKHPGP